MANHYQLMNAGEAVRKAGYRAVLVDMRGFGQSTGEHITFGVLDAHDLKQLTDELEKRGMAAPALGVYGTSMGAASAILYAAEDPRVKTVIAVAPFATIRDEVPSFGRHVLRGASAFFTDSQVNAIADAVAGMADLDLDAAKPLDAIQKTKAPVLLIHGEADTIIPVEASEKLHAAAPDRTELLKIPRRGHLDLCFDVRGELQAATREWLEKHLNAER
jgi:pimeloyl-ACP methyl ester carboxylesterase